MYRLNTRKFVRDVRRRFSSQVLLSEEVKFALETRKPVVALESTIITHGMPYPENLKCAQAVENIVREQGATPATTAIIGGKIKVGLTHNEMNELADTEARPSTKTSRRDLAYVVGQRLNGGTTVSGTMIIAHRAGIPIFVTGGIGGVHRLGEQTLDISADLTELGRTPIAVISSGVKSILDIPKTLEYLETQGVFVATYGTSTNFPAFYSRRSGCDAPYHVPTPRKAAEIIKHSLDLDLKSGLLIAVPIPEEHAFDEELLNQAIDNALENARRENITGKHVTPYLLKEVSNITKGKSLQSNIALIKNNALIGAKIAVELQKIRNNEEKSPKIHQVNSNSPVVIGGSNIDCCATLTDPELLADGVMNNVKYTISAGGVARNICEALGKLGAAPSFISAIGNDDNGKYIQSLLPAKATKSLEVIPGYSTAQCTVVLDTKGDCKILLGEMDIHKQITPEMIKSQEELLKQSPLLVTDGNLPVESLSCVLEIAHRHEIPVFHETTDVVLAELPFRTPHWKNVKFMSPNLNELKQIARYLKIHTRNDSDDPIADAAALGKTIGQFVNLIITLGHHGVMIVRKANVDEPLLSKNIANDVRVRYYKTEVVEELVNVSGAGDCLASGFIAAMLKGLPEPNCISVGFAAAGLALQSRSAIPEVFFGDEHVAWSKCAQFIEIY